MSGEGGRGKVGLVVTVLVALVAVSVAMEVLPVQWRVSQLYDFMVEQAGEASHDRVTTIQQRILEKGQELGLPLTEEQVEVRKEEDQIIMRCHFDVPVTVLFHTFEWKVDRQVQRDLFQI